MSHISELFKKVEEPQKQIDTLKDQNETTVKLINKRMDGIPDVLDSKPKVYRRKVPKYLLKKDEKWTRIKEDGTIEYMDLQPGEWD